MCTGLLLILLILIGAAVLIWCLYYKNTSNSPRLLRYGQGKEVAYGAPTVIPVTGQGVQYAWTFDTGGAANDDITFNLQIVSGLTNIPPTDWTTPLITQTLASTGSFVYTSVLSTGTSYNYTYSMSDPASIALFDSYDYYWSRIQAVVNGASSDWDVTDTPFNVIGAITPALVNMYPATYAVVGNPVTLFWKVPGFPAPKQGEPPIPVDFATIQSMSFVFDLDTNNWSDYNVVDFTVPNLFDVTVSGSTLTVAIDPAATSPTPTDAIYAPSCNAIISSASAIQLDADGNYWFYLIANAVTTAATTVDTLTLTTSGTLAPTTIQLQCIASIATSTLVPTCTNSGCQSCTGYTGTAGTCLCCIYDATAPAGTTTSDGTSDPDNGPGVTLCLSSSANSDSTWPIVSTVPAPGALLTFTWTSPFTEPKPQVVGAILTFPLAVGANQWAYDWTFGGEKLSITFQVPSGMYSGLTDPSTFNVSLLVPNAIGEGIIAATISQSLIDSIAVDAAPATAFTGTWNDGS